MIGVIRVQFFAPVVALLMIGLVGCRTADRHDASKPPEAVTHEDAEFPSSIRIPLGVSAREYLAEVVALPSEDHTTNRIWIAVGGEVASPGVFWLRPGTTALQAIAHAGGFTDFAFSRRIRLQKASGFLLTLYLQIHYAHDGHMQVWYDTHRLGNSVADYVLDPGDRISVGRSL